jgi:nucleoside-diphosphate-sugar epimerase
MSKKVLITGGTGFLGCHLSRLLLKKKYDVILYDLAPLDAKDLQGKVTVIQGDIRDTEKMKKALKGVTYIVHAAAALPIQRDKETIYNVNIDGTKSVLEAGLEQKVKRLVFISSTAVYGVPKHLPETEEAPLDPIGFYGESKIAGEKLCLEFEKKGLQVNIIRPKTFLGPERLGVFQLWFEAMYTGKPIFLLGDGTNLYQLLAVVDVASAILHALESKVHGEIFNIGAKDFGTWKSDLGNVISYAKSQTKIIALPVKLSQFLLGILEQLNLSPIAAWHYKTLPVPSYVSTKKAEKLLGWKATKSNTALLLESYQWYEKHRDEIIGRKGKTHRVGWNFGVLDIFSKIFS